MFGRTSGIRSFGQVIPFCFTGDQTVTVWRAHCTGEVTALAVGRNAVLGTYTHIDSTNYVAVVVYDAGSGGTGTAIIASRGAASTKWTALKGYALLTDGSSTAYKLDKGDYVTLKFREAGGTIATGSPYFVYGTFVPGIVDERS